MNDYHFLVALLAKLKASFNHLEGPANAFTDPRDQCWGRRLTGDAMGPISYAIAERVYYGYPKQAPSWWNEPAPPVKRRKLRKAPDLSKYEREPLFKLRMGITEEELSVLQSLPLPMECDLLETSFEYAVQKRLLAEGMPVICTQRISITKREAQRFLAQIYAARAELIWMMQANISRMSEIFIHSVAGSLACIMEWGLIPLYKKYPELMPPAFACIMELEAQRPRRQREKI